MFVLVNLFKKSIIHFSHKVTLKTMYVGILIQIISLNHLVVLLLMKKDQLP